MENSRMGNRIKQTKTNLLKQLAIGCLGIMAFSGTGFCADKAAPWWNAEWTVRKKITIDTTSSGSEVTQPIGSPTVLIRLSDGVFNFSTVKEDGSDIRIVAADGKTVLPCQVEKIDATVMNTAFVWVKIPDLKPGSKTDIWLYYGNEKAEAQKPEDVKKTFDKETVLAYHFGDKSTLTLDSSASGANAANPGTFVDGSLIGGGVRFLGKSAIAVPGAAPLTWIDGGAMTWSAWIKPVDATGNVVLFSRHEGSNSFVIGLQAGVPYAEVQGSSGTQRATGKDALAASAWRHLAVTADGSKIALYVDGEQAGAVSAALPALKGPALIGGDGAVGAGADGSPTAPEGAALVSGFTGEMDEVEISNVARPQGFLQFAAVGQGMSDKAGKLIAIGNDEATGGASENELTKHLSLIQDISKSLTPDGWAVIFLCTILALVGGVVSVMKLMYLSKVKKGTNVFLKQWEQLSADLSVLDHGDEENIKSMGGQANAKAQRLMRQAPIYHIYRIGSEEIQHRINNSQEEFRGLSGRSMQAIRATLDGGLVRETQKLNSNLVFLTIGIAGGPYLGLLGTVIGVMITFAVIAKSGAVEVNSIAPGIAGALLATVAGLAVAIPALFAYSYISTRIKEAVNDMTIFIDEFVAKVAEVFPE